MAKVVNDHDADDLTQHPAYALGVKHAYAGIAPKPAGVATLPRTPPGAMGAPPVRRFQEGGTPDPTDLTNPANRNNAPIASPQPAPTPSPVATGTPPSGTVAAGVTAPVPTGGGAAAHAAATGVIPAKVPPPAAKIAQNVGAPGSKLVGNTPAGYDYNLGTNRYVPQGDPGTINGRPADVVGAESRAAGAAGVASLPRTPVVAGPTPAVGGTQAVLPQSKFLPAGRNGASGVVDREERIPGGSQANRLATPQFKAGGKVKKMQDGGPVDPGIGVVNLNKIGVQPATETPKYKAGGKISKPKVNDHDEDDFKAGGKVKRYQDGGKTKPSPTPSPTPPMRNDPATLKRMVNSPEYKSGGRVKKMAEGGEIGTVNLPNINIQPATESPKAQMKSGGKVRKMQDGGTMGYRHQIIEQTPATASQVATPPKTLNTNPNQRIVSDTGRIPGDKTMDFRPGAYKFGGQAAAPMSMPNGAQQPAAPAPPTVGAPPPRVPNPPDNVPAMLGKGEVVLNKNQQKRVAVQPNFRQGLNPREATAMEGMNLPRMRKQSAFKPKPSKMFAGK